MSRTAIIYLIHADQPIGSTRHSASHYLGSCVTGGLGERLRQHWRGAGARITAVFREKRIDFQIVRIWKGGRKKERLLKNFKNHKAFCPLCNAESFRINGRLSRRSPQPKPIHAIRRNILQPSQEHLMF